MITRRTILKSATAMALAQALPKSVLSSPRQGVTALYWNNMGEAVGCELCPNRCVLANGKTGVCRTRQNRNGTLVNNAYANPCAVHIDPIEKKPIFHCWPGTKSFSIAVAGCNLRCLNCQNYTISQQFPQDTATVYLPPDKVVSEAKRLGCTSIAYTYSEPVVWFEYVLETAKLAKKEGLKNIWITAGYINDSPLRELSQYIDAANINLKSFSENIYIKLNGATLKPVLETICNAKKYGIWVEVTNLIVPTWTDNVAMIRAMCKWHKNYLGSDTPLHFSRFFPLYKLQNLYPTPGDVLLKAKAIAESEGLSYVYVGNVAEIDSNTYCPHCRKLLVERNGLITGVKSLVNGKCGHCKTDIKGLWA